MFRLLRAGPLTTTGAPRVPESHFLTRDGQKQKVPHHVITSVYNATFSKLT